MATNPFAVQVKPLDLDQPGSPTTMTYHGASIRVGNNIIGRIKEWTPGQFTRQVNAIREVNRSTWGVPIDNVPGIAEGFNISFTRSEIWGDEIERAFGYTTPWTNLTDQTYPFEVDEILFRGNVQYRVWQYKGCWFTEKNLNAWSADGNGIIEVSCGLAYVTRFQII